MEKLRTVTVGEGCWRMVKLGAVAEGVTMRAWLEELVSRLASGVRVESERPVREIVVEPAKELVYTREGEG